MTKKKKTPKVVDNAMPLAKIEPPVEEETKEEPVEEEQVEVASEEQATEEEAAEAQPPEPEPKEEAKDKEEVELTEAERLALLPAQLLSIYEASPAGRIPLWKVLKETGATTEEINRAWDILFGQRKVPYSRLYKPETGRVALEG